MPVLAPTLAVLLAGYSLRLPATYRPVGVAAGQYWDNSTLLFARANFHMFLGRIL
jgi:hypothetical protein